MLENFNEDKRKNPMPKFYDFHTGWSIVVFFLSALFFSCINPTKSSKKKYSGHIFGTTFSILYYSPDSDGIKQGIDSILSVVDTNFSTYNLNSTVSVLNSKADSLQVDEDFAKVFLKSKEVWRKTNGKFDLTTGKLTNLWGFGSEEKPSIVDSALVDSIMSYVGFQKMSLVDCVVKKENSAIYLDFNALAKGYALDKIGDFFKGKEINDYLIEIGGEILANGSKEGEPWLIGIDKPIENEFNQIQVVVELTDEALASSGNYRKFYKDAEGRKIAHTMNPLTGYPEVSKLLSASVIAKTCMEADAYATAFMVMGLDESMDFAEKTPSLDVLLIWHDENQGFNYFTSKGFKSKIRNMKPETRRVHEHL